MTKKDEAVQRLKNFLPHLKTATEMARLQHPDAEVGLAVVAVLKDGGGRVTARFRGEFADDLLLALGYENLDALIAEIGREEQREIMLPDTDGDGPAPTEK